MTKELKGVVWDWFPGFVAGLIPLVLFLFVSAVATIPPAETPAEWWAKFNNGLVDHLLILSIVTSSVSLFSATPRLFRTGRAGGGSLVQIMLATFILALAIALYVLRQAEVTQVASLWASGFILAVGFALAAAVSSYYLEVTVTNLGLRRRGKKSNATGA